MFFLLHSTKCQFCQVPIYDSFIANFIQPCNFPTQVIHNIQHHFRISKILVSFFRSKVVYA